MINYIEYLNVPTKVAITLVGIFLIMQVVGELLEFKGKVVPEFVKVRKYFTRKKDEREMLKETLVTLQEVKTLLNNVDRHYSSDNIAMRDQWILNVNQKLEEHDDWRKEFGKKLDQNNKDTLSLLIDNKRDAIINFASYAIDENKPVTREQFKRIFRIHEEYEKIIDKSGITNGEVDIAFRIITESYENHMKNHTFIEDVRGY